jgi:hypothetical protein
MNKTLTNNDLLQLKEQKNKNLFDLKLFPKNRMYFHKQPKEKLKSQGEKYEYRKMLIYEGVL